MTKSNSAPVAQGKYLPAIRHGGVIYTSGMTPRKDGVLVHSGKIRAAEPIESYRDAARLATLNALIAAQACLKDGEKIGVILHMDVYLNAEPDFASHPKVADFASELLIEYLGPASLGTRAAIGVASLPSDATVEVTLVAAVAGCD